MKKSFRYFLILCLSLCLTACSLGPAGDSTSNLESSPKPTVTDGLQDASETDGQESGEGTGAAAATESGAKEEPTAATETSSAQEPEESELDMIPRWSMAEISNAKAGDIVTFGTYEQDNDPENGSEPIEWFILDMENGQAVLLSVYLLDCQKYHSEEVEVTWADCAMRTWLNDDFLHTAFTESEQERIAVTKLVNGDNPAHGTKGGNDTSDKIWLLSLEDVEKYLHISVKKDKNPYIKDNQTLEGYAKYCYDQDHRIIAEPTAYAVKQGCYPFDVDEAVKQAKKRGTSGSVLEEFRAEMEVYRYANGGADWLLRSPGYDAKSVAAVGNTGRVYYGGIFVTAKYGVRPALTVTY